MRLKAVFHLLAVLSLLFAATPFAEAGGDYPYQLEDYQSLNLPDAFRASFSHDGELVVFSSNAEKPDNSSIWVAKADGTDRRMVYRNSSIDDTFSSAKFSPDGEKIAFTKFYLEISKEESELSIEVLERNGTTWDETSSNRSIHKRPKGALRSPSFSPDRKKIVYYSIEPTEGGKGDVWVMDIDSSNRTQLTFDKEGGVAPSYSPDGKKVLYQRWSDDGELEIWLMDSDGTNNQMILDDSWHPHHPTFMPDGKILFESTRASPHSKETDGGYLWMMDQDGGNRTLLVPSSFDGKSFNSRASVSSDGTKILFEHSLSDRDLYIVEDPDGDGVWEDSDGDGVADICDKYPDDPDRGYIKDGDEDNDLAGFGFGAAITSVLIAVLGTGLLRKRRENTINMILP